MSPQRGKGYATIPDGMSSRIRSCSGSSFANADGRDSGSHCWQYSRLFARLKAVSDLTEIGWGWGGTKWEASEQDGYLVLVLPHLVQEPDCDALYCDGSCSMQTSIGLFHIDLVAHDLFSGMVLGSSVGGVLGGGTGAWHA